MEKLKKLLRYVVVKIFRKLPKHKYKLTRFYKSKTKFLAYLFVFSCFIAVPFQFLFYFSTSMYYFQTNFKDTLRATTPIEEAAEFSKYNEWFSYTFKDGYINQFLKSHFDLSDADLIYKNTGNNYEIESNGMLSYKLHGQNVDIHTMKIEGQTVLAGIPEYLFNQCLFESYNYHSKITHLNKCTRIMFITLSLIKFDPLNDKARLNKDETIEIKYSDGKTLDIAYGDLDYVRKFYIRKGSD